MITAEYLTNEIAALEQQREELKANLYMVNGALQVLQQQLALVQRSGQEAQPAADEEE